MPRFVHTKPNGQARAPRGARRRVRLARRWTACACVAGVFGLFAPWPLLAAGAKEKAAACIPPRGAPETAARITGLAPDGSLDLEDGRRFVPARIILPTRLEPSPAVRAAAARAVLTAVGGRPVALFATATDRHGRLTGEARLAAGTGDDLAAALVAAGAAYADAQAPCAAPLLAQEAQARDDRRGLWARPEAITDAADEQAMGRRRGLHTVAEGQILAVGVRRERTYLNFGEIWRRDFTVILPTADFAIMFGHGGVGGPNPAMLRGARVRVRGVVREQGGPAMMVRSAAEIVRLADRMESGERR